MTKHIDITIYDSPLRCQISVEHGPERCSPDEEHTNNQYGTAKENGGEKAVFLVIDPVAQDTGKPEKTYPYEWDEGDGNGCMSCMAFQLFLADI